MESRVALKKDLQIEHEFNWKGIIMKIVQCSGDGQGSCKRCIDNGKWNVNWMCFLYKIEGLDGCYCSDCVKKITEEKKYEIRTKDKF